jgi:hypothetical protein
MRGYPYVNCEYNRAASERFEAAAVTDVFLSYAREDKERARKVAAALEARGLSVWWDRKIAAGETFDQAIERELDAAKNVVVLWSEHSVPSEWVRNEAAAAAERGVLVPVLIDQVKVPLEFRHRQTIDLTGWNDDPSHEGITQLLDRTCGNSARQATERAPAAAGAKPRWNRKWTVVALAATVAVLLAGATLAGLMPKQSPSAGQPSVAGVWRHRSGVILVVKQNGSAVSLEQVDPASGVTVTGTGTLQGNELQIRFVYKADGGTAHGVFTVSGDGQRLSGDYTDEATGSRKALVFER